MRKKNPTTDPDPLERGPSQEAAVAARGAARGAVDRAVRKASSVRGLLLSAYDAGKRSLPWRGVSDPYRIWVSEVMLQQTRVETVIPYYVKWLERFPDIDALAEAREDDVLRVWQGLGYYSRARRLQEGARVVRERFGGSVPGTKDDLRSLPGVGDYTSGAVASIAFGEAVPAVDGNARRVLSRMFDLADPSPATLREIAGELVDPERPGDFNQALMELGALTCVSRSPRCEACPLRSVCLAQERGTVEARPRSRSKKPVPEVDVAVVVAVTVACDASGGIQFLLRKRPDTGLLAGMWEFPGVDVGAEKANGGSGALRLAIRESAMALAVELGFDPEHVPADSNRGPGAPAQEPRISAEGAQIFELEMVPHVFSHLKARYWPLVFLIDAPANRRRRIDGSEWIASSDIDGVPLPVAQGRIARAALESVGTRWGVKSPGRSGSPGSSGGPGRSGRSAPEEADPLSP